MPKRDILVFTDKGSSSGSIDLQGLAQAKNITIQQIKSVTPKSKDWPADTVEILHLPEMNTDDPIILFAVSPAKQANVRKLMSDPENLKLSEDQIFAKLQEKPSLWEDIRARWDAFIARLMPKRGEGVASGAGRGFLSGLIGGALAFPAFIMGVGAAIGAAIGGGVLGEAGAAIGAVIGAIAGIVVLATTLAPVTLFAMGVGAAAGAVFGAIAGAVRGYLQPEVKSPKKVVLDPSAPEAEPLLRSDSTLKEDLSDTNRIRRGLGAIHPDTGLDNTRSPSQEFAPPSEPGPERRSSAPPSYNEAVKQTQQASGTALPKPSAPLAEPPESPPSRRPSSRSS